MTAVHQLAREALRLAAKADRLKAILDATLGDRGGQNGPRGRAAKAYREADQAARAAAIRCCEVVARPDHRPFCFSF